MVKLTLQIEGMACSMCEAHLCEALRRAFPIKKITASYKKGQVQMIAEAEPERSALEEAIRPTGYQLLSVQCEPYEKKGLFPFGPRP